MRTEHWNWEHVMIIDNVINRLGICGDYFVRTQCRLCVRAVMIWWGRSDVVRMYWWKWGDVMTILRRNNCFFVRTQMLILWGRNWRCCMCCHFPCWRIWWVTDNGWWRLSWNDSDWHFLLRMIQIDDGLLTILYRNKVFNDIINCMITVEFLLAIGNC